ncbi:MAG: LysR family transcriptional regulator, partial [Gammaproteobacteria bacterium]|nr:LysR family transcriptional regulator [Gammaproteobacteria bacterium]
MKTSYDRLMNWEDFKIILAVARAGGLNAAAKNLGVSHSTVFRQLNAIEERFATRFFERLPQGYELTTAGETAVEFATSMEAGINDLVGKLQGSDSRLQGSIRLTAPIGITHYLLSSHIAEFRRLHPEIDIELIVTSNPLELSRREADVAIRVTKTPPETAIGRKVGVYQMALYASKAYLASVAEKNLTEYDVLTTCNG